MSKQLLPILICLMPALLWGQNPIKQKFQAEKLYYRGLSMFENQNYRDAIGLFNQAINLDPDHAKALELRGDSYYELRDYNQAYADYTRSVSLQPNNPEVYNSLGVTAAKLELYRSAIQYFREALSIDPGHPQAQANLARAEKLQEDARQNIASGAGTDPWGNQNQPGYGTPSYPNNTNTGTPGYGTPGYGTPGYGTPGTNPGYGTPGYGSPGYGNPNVPITTAPSQPDRSLNQETNYAKSQIKVGNQTDPLLRIENVKITPTATLVTFVAESASDKSFPLKLDDWRGKNAWYLTTLDFEKTYKLKHIKLPGWPDRDYLLKPGESKLFVAEFERIDDDVDVFHVLEGKLPAKSAWNFYEVRLIN